MDSSYFLISSNTSTNTGNLNNDLEQSSFNYDPFDGFSFLDQQGMRFYDYFGASGDRNSPIIYQSSFDQFDLHHHQTTQKNFPFLQTDPNQEDDDDLQGTLTSFASDLGVDSDAGYTSGVDLFATNNIDCSDSTEAYYLRLALEQNSGSSCSSSSSNSSSASGSNNNISDECHLNNNNFSDINNNINTSSCSSINNNNDNNTSSDYGCISYNNCNGDSNTSRAVKRSVLMNLLIDGSDVGAGYTSYNCRALPQRITTQHQQQPSSGNLDSQTNYRPLGMDGNWKVTTK